MNDHPALTDARIRRALAPAPDATAPAGLLRDALEAVSRTPQRRFPLRLPWGSSVGGGFRPVPSPALAWLAAALVILALLGVALVAGHRPKEDRAVTVPESFAVLQPSAVPQPSGAGFVQRVFAVSGDEAYAGAGDELTELWHFSDGRWEGPEALGGAILSIIALPGDGLAAATSDGLFIRDAGGWSATPFPQRVNGVVVVASPDGSLWAAGPPRGDGQHDLIHLRLLDGSWQEARTTCPAGGLLLALTSDGAVWTGGIGYNGTGGLARYDGRTCVAMSLPGGSARPDVTGLAAGPSGELAVAAYDPPYLSGPGRAVVAVYGATWSTVKVVENTDACCGIVGFDGTGDLWVSGMPPGLVRWHRTGGAWVEAQALVSVGDLAGWGQSSLAGDGTLWYVDGSGTIRRARP